MGSHNSNIYSEGQLPGQFKELKNQYDIYQSILDGSRLQKHIIELRSEQQIKYEQQIFLFRRMNAERVVTARFFQNFSPKNICGSVYRICYFTQCPKYNFGQTLRIPIQEGIQLIIQCLEGFEILYKKFGGFQITGSQIFLDQKNKLKVWICENLAQVKPQFNCTREKIIQQYMVNQIFKIFDRSQPPNNTPTLYTTFLRKLQDKQRDLVGFGKVIEHMLEIKSRYFVNRTKRQTTQNPNSLPMSKVAKNKNNPSVRSLKAQENKTNRKSTHHNGKTTRKSQEFLEANRKGTEAQKKTVKLKTQIKQQKHSIKNSAPNIDQIFKFYGHPNLTRNQTRDTDNFMQSNEDPNTLKKNKRHIRRSADDCYVETLTPIQKLTNIRNNENGIKQKNKANRNNNLDKQNRISITKLNCLAMDTNHEHFLKQLTTVKSIVHNTDINLDSDIRIDVENYQHEMKMQGIQPKYYW